jgi:hypothetical protein
VASYSFNTNYCVIILCSRPNPICQASKVTGIFLLIFCCLLVFKYECNTLKNSHYVHNVNSCRHSDFNLHVLTFLFCTITTIEIFSFFLYFLLKYTIIYCIMYSSLYYYFRALHLLFFIHDLICHYSISLLHGFNFYLFWHSLFKGAQLLNLLLLRK